MILAHRLSLLTLAIAAAVPAGAQTTVYRDSAEFDNRFGRLREIDFEDVYSITLQNVLIRNPWGLNVMSVEYVEPGTTPPDTTDDFLWLGQGATLDFPTRTRRVVLGGYATPFYVRVFDFNDSVIVTRTQDYPVDLTVATGIKRIQLLGDDGDPINWRGGLKELTTFDDDGDTLAWTDFDELTPGTYYLVGKPFDAYLMNDDSLLTAPLTWHGVTFTDTNYGFSGTPLAPFEARADPDNPIMNLAVEMAPRATIEFPEGTEGALLVLEQVMKRDTFLLEVEDWSGRIDTTMEIGWGREYDTTWDERQQVTFAHLGFGSDAGVRRIRLLDAWSVEIDDFFDTLTYDRTMMLAAVYVAEAPPVEIVSIGACVEKLDTAGYVDLSRYPVLVARLDDARTAAAAGNNTTAIDALQLFRNEVARLGGQTVLAPEEARAFDADAAYVITRLRGSSAVYDARAVMTGLEIGVPMVGDAAVTFHVRLPNSGTLRIVDMRGQTIESVPVTREQSIARWDMGASDNSHVVNGTYLIALTVDGITASRLVSIAR